MKRKISITGKSLNNIKLPTQDDGNYLFFDDFETDLNKWSVASGAPSIVELSRGKVLQLNESDSLVADIPIDSDCLFKLSFEMKKETIDSVGAFLLTFEYSSTDYDIKLSQETENFVRFSKVMAIDNAETKPLRLTLSCSEGKVYFDNISLLKLEPTRTETFSPQPIANDWIANPNFSYSLENNNAQYLEVSSESDIGPYALNGVRNLLTLKELFSPSSIVDANNFSINGVVLYVKIEPENTGLHFPAFGRLPLNGEEVYFVPLAGINAGDSFGSVFANSSFALIGNYPYSNYITGNEPVLIEYGIGCYSNDNTPLQKVIIREINIYKGIVEEQITMDD